MKRITFAHAALMAALAVLALLIIDPRIDLTISGWFYTPDKGFAYAATPVAHALQFIAYYGARVLAVSFAALAAFAFLRRAQVCAINAKGWLFLFLALAIGPGLIANAGFKDHWGRARPREIADFGGAAYFSPALQPQPEIRPNGSFVSGDGAFGFFLPSLAYVVPLRRSRRAFWAGMAGGLVFGGSRIAMGAHFFSDVFFAALVVMGASAALFRVIYGAGSLRERWRLWWGNPSGTAG